MANRKWKMENGKSPDRESRSSAPLLLCSSAKDSCDIVTQYEAYPNCEKAAQFYDQDSTNIRDGAHSHGSGPDSDSSCSNKSGRRANFLKGRRSHSLQELCELPPAGRDRADVAPYLRKRTALGEGDSRASSRRQY